MVIRPPPAIIRKLNQNFILIGSMKICIIGAGASGILLSLLLHQSGMTTSDFCIVDPHFDGGALQRKWMNVVSNTTWSATTHAFHRCLPLFKLPSWAQHLPPDKPTPLHTIAKLLRDLFIPLKIQTIRGTVCQATWKSENEEWTVSIQSGREGTTEINCKRLLFAQGSFSKQYDTSIPSIPLDIALDVARLKTYLSPSDQVVVFGTNHSGTLVLKNLVDLGVKHITAVHKSSRPFIWARDGEYDGLKLDGATIADSIVSGTYASIRLIPYENTPGLIKETRNASWVVYATGFQPDTSIRVMNDNTVVSYIEYDPKTGALKNLPNAWGFGIAYPSQALDGIHYDVGISSFMEHFYRQIPALNGGDL